MSTETDLLAALTGSASVGAYPDTIHDRLDKALAAAWVLSTGLNINVPTLGGDPGPYRGAADAWSADYDQAVARYGTAPKARTLAEKAQLLEVLVRGIDTKQPAPDPAHAPTGTWPPSGSTFASRWAAGDIHDGEEFASADWDFQSTTPTLVASPVRSGGKALRIAFAAGAKQSPAKGASPNPDARRCELEPASMDKVQSGDTWWVRYDVLLESGWPIDTETWAVLGQFKQGPSGSPPVELAVERGRWKVIRHGTSSNPLGSVDLGPAVTGKVQRVVWGATFGDSTHGKTGGSVDGVRVADATGTTWNNQGALYAKCPGIYADNALSGAMAAVFDTVVVGSTYDSVA